MSINRVLNELFRIADVLEVEGHLTSRGAVGKQSDWRKERNLSNRV